MKNKVVRGMAVGLAGVMAVSGISPVSSVVVEAEETEDSSNSNEGKDGTTTPDTKAENKDITDQDNNTKGDSDPYVAVKEDIGVTGSLEGDFYEADSTVYYKDAKLKIACASLKDEVTIQSLYITKDKNTTNKISEVEGNYLECDLVNFDIGLYLNVVTDCGTVVIPVAEFVDSIVEGKNYESDIYSPIISFSEFTGSMEKDSNGVEYFTSSGTLVLDCNDSKSGVDESSLEISLVTVSGSSLSIDTSKYHISNGKIYVEVDSISDDFYYLYIVIKDNLGNRTGLNYGISVFMSPIVVTGTGLPELYTDGNKTYLKSGNSFSVSVSSARFVDSVYVTDDNKVSMVNVNNGYFSISEDCNLSKVVVVDVLGREFDYSLQTVFNSSLGNEFIIDDDSPVLSYTDSNKGFQSTMCGLFYASKKDLTYSLEDYLSGVKADSISVVDDITGVAVPFSYENGVLSVSVSGLNDGKHCFKIYAEDNLGNTLESYGGLDDGFSLYTFNPTLVGSEHGSAYVDSDRGITYFDSEVEFEFSIEKDKVMSIELFKDGEYYSDISKDGNTFKVSEDGEYTVLVADVLGGEKFYKISDLFSDLGNSFVRDTDAPVIKDIEFNGSSKESEGVIYYTSEGDIEISVEDSKSGVDSNSWNFAGVDKSNVEISRSGNKITIPTTVLEEGTNEITVSVCDNLGNKSSRTFTIEMFRVVPIIESESFTGTVFVRNNKTYTTGDILVSVDGTDSKKIKKVILMKDDKETEDITKSGTFTVSEGGNYIIKVVLKTGDEVTYTLEQLFDGDITSGIEFDTSTPMLSGVSFSGESTVGFEDNIYFTSDGILTVSAKDTGSGIDDSTWEVQGVSSYTLSDDGSSISFNTDELPENRSTIYFSVRDNLGNLCKFSVSPYMYRIKATLRGNAHSSVVNSSDGKSYFKNAVEVKLSGYSNANLKEIFLMKEGSSDGVEIESGTFSIEDTGVYTVKTVDIVGDVHTYKLEDLFSDLYSNMIFDTEGTVFEGISFTGDSVDVDGTTYYTSNGVYSITFKDTGVGVDGDTWFIDNAGLDEIKSVSNDGRTVSFVTDGLPEGTTSIQVRVKDRLGNEGTYSLSLNMFREAPEITGNQYSQVKVKDGIVYCNSSIAFKLEGYNNYKIKSIDVVKDGKITDKVVNGEFVIKESGSYEVRVEDLVGNVNVYKLEELFTDLSSNVVIDSVIPKAEVLVNGSAVTNDWVTGDAVLNVKVSDETGLSEVDVYVNNEKYSRRFDSLEKTGEVNIDLSTVTRAMDGKYAVSVLVTDYSGNTSTTALVEVLADFDKPKFGEMSVDGMYIEDGDALYVKGSLTIEGSVSDIGSGVESIELVKDGKSTVVELPIEINSSGEYSLVVKDKAGLSESIDLKSIMVVSTNKVVIDNVIPSMERRDGFTPDMVVGDVNWYKDCPEISYLITDDNLKSVKFTVNGSEVTPTEKNGIYGVSVDGIEGSVTVIVEALDKAGNLSKDTYSFMIDTKAPINVRGTIEESYISKGGKLFFKKNPVVSVNATDEGIGVDKFTLSSGNSNSSGVFELGTGEFFLEVIDKLGNTTERFEVSNLTGLESNSFIVDSTAPEIKSNKPKADSGEWYKDKIKYSIDVSDDIGLDSAVVRVNGTVMDSIDVHELNIKNLALSVDMSKAVGNKGEYLVDVVVVDNAGNESTYSEAVYIDDIEPIVEKFVFTGNGSSEGYEVDGSDRYGFFFNDSAVCDVYVSDGEYSSGLNTVVVKLESSDGSVETREVAVSGGVARVQLPSGFKGFISAYGVDAVGNVGKTNKPDGVVLENANWHTNSILMDIELPNTDKKDLSGNNLYNSSVDMTATVGCSASGIKKLEWGIGGDTLGVVNVDGDGNLSGDTGVVKSKDKNLVVNLSKAISATSNMNDLKVWVRATDRVGHTSLVEKLISIDKDAPVISVSYNDTNASGYYASNRVATVTVEERNFDPSKFIIEGSYGTVGSWSQNGNTWVNTITFSEDKDYEFTLNCTDRAGNKATAYSSGKFTVDRTAPVMSVSWNNNSPSNGNYFNTDRVATVTVVEHNFDSSLFKLEGNGSLSSWSSNGDIHTATVSFNADGEYEFSISGADKSGNNATSYSSGKFIVDKTVPVLSIEGIQSGVSYKEHVGFKVTMSDAYLDASNTSVELVGKRNGVIRVSGSVGEKAGEFIFSSIPVEEVYDDIYTLTVKVTDKAGNVRNESIRFSVNRFGSKFNFSDNDLLNSYLGSAKDVVITEVNVDRLDISRAKVSIIRDGSEIEVDSKYISIVESEGESGKYTYTYTISKEAFDEDGKYLVQIYSHSEVGDDYSSVSEEYAFVLDTTAPVILISGVKSDKQYKDYSRKVSIEVRDASGVDSIRVLLNGEEVVLSKSNGVYYFEVSESDGVQNIKVEVVDLAGNKSVEEVGNFLVSSNTWLFIVNQAWFKWSIGAAVSFIAIMLLLLAKRRHEDKSEEERVLKEHSDLYKTSSSYSGSGYSGKDEVEDLEEGGTPTTSKVETENILSGVLEGEPNEDLSPDYSNTSDGLSDMENATTSFMDEDEATNALDENDATDTLE